MKNKKEKFIDIMRREAKETKKMTYLELLVVLIEIFITVGAMIFFALIGVSILPQISKDIQPIFAASILCAVCFVLFVQFKAGGLFNEEDRE